MTVERIVAGAIAIVDRDGLDGLSMRTLAVELETGTATLYRYVQSKEEVLVEALDAVLGEIRMPPEFARARSWKSRITMMATALRAGLLAHPNITPLLATTSPIGPNALAGREAMLDVLIDAGFAPSMATRAYLAIVHYVIGFVLAENPQSPAYGVGQRRSLNHYYSGLPAQEFPHLVALADDLTARDNEEEFVFGLGLLLDGVQDRASTKNGAARRKSGSS